MTQIIRWKKRRLEAWIRDDGESKKEVHETNMYREIQKYINDGWRIIDGWVDNDGVSVRTITIIRNE